MFVADFIGSPPMNFLPFRGGLQAGAQAIRLGERDGRRSRGARGRCRKAISCSASGPSMSVSPIAASLRGEVFGAEYLGTTQIVTVTTRYGALKARSPASVSFRTGENVGLDFRPDTLSLFDKASGRAIRTALHEGGAHG